MRFPCRQFVGALTIILMALSTTAPLSYSHTHEATVCHEHVQQHAHGVGRARVHCHRHCHAENVGTSIPMMLAPQTHWHVFWWGLELVLTSPPTDDSGQPTRDFDGTQLESLRAPSTEVAVDLAASPHLLSPVALLVRALPVPPTAAVERGTVARPERNLVCDAARRARTGVQLL